MHWKVATQKSRHINLLRNELKLETKNELMCDFNQKQDNQANSPSPLYKFK
jgi:hypothetical protein